MSIYFFFIDGIGLAERGENNPFGSTGLPFFNERCSENGFFLSSARISRKEQVFIPIDANLEIEGLPQSGTGQVSLFTGLNAAEHIGRHFGPYPHSQTHQLLKDQSIPKQLNDLGKSFRFMNAYPPIFFKLSEERNRWSTSTLMCRQQALPLHTIEDVFADKGITAEITQEVWRERLALDIPTIPIEAAVSRMIRAGAHDDLVMYEYYLTDKAGHAMDAALAQQVLQRLDTFLGLLYRKLSDDDLIVISSDHGNIEDLSVKTHTRNPVPLMALGKNADQFSRARSITDVTPIIMELSGG